MRAFGHAANVPYSLYSTGQVQYVDPIPEKVGDKLTAWTAWPLYMQTSTMASIEWAFYA